MLIGVTHVWRKLNPLKLQKEKKEREAAIEKKMEFRLCGRVIEDNSLYRRKKPEKEGGVGNR